MKRVPLKRAHSKGHQYKGQALTRVPIKRANINKGANKKGEL